MVALSIIKQLEIAGTSHIIVTRTFAGASGVAERLAHLEAPFSGISIVFAQSIPEAYQLLRRQRFSEIFIDADVGVRKFFDLLRIRFRHWRANINVYEEGLGTYRTDLYRGMKKSTLQLIGIGTRFGGSSLTSKLYLYSPSDYKRLFPSDGPTLIKIEEQLSTFINKHLVNLNDIFDYKSDYKVTSKDCLIYLSSWSVDQYFIKQLGLLSGDQYIKLHPHITDFDEIGSGNYIDPSAPAEMVITELLTFYDNIDVYHHGSSVMRYIKSDRVSYNNI